MKNNTILSVLVLFLIATCGTYGQSSEAEIDLVIVVNEEIAIELLGNMKLVVENETEVNTIEPQYYPGSLVMNKSDLDLLLSNNVKSITFCFDQYENDPANGKFFYEIDFDKKWLTQRYIVLKIYNLEKTKYKMMYEPLSSGKNYTFEIDSPDFTFRRVLKN